MSERQTVQPEDTIAAGEFVLGLLDPAERASAERRARYEQTFARQIYDWEERLAGLAAPLAAVTPPKRVKRAVNEALFGQPKSSMPRMLRSVAFWRAASGVMATAVIVLGLLMFAVQDRVVHPDIYVAALAPAEAPSSILVRINHHNREILVRAPQLSGDQEIMELWLIPKGFPPRSLGPLRPLVDNILILSAADISAVIQGSSLAISAEPAGGSPTGQPSGPILALGTIEPI